MNFKEFQEQALRTESKIISASMDIEGVKKLLEMFIGVGTLLDYTKKGVFYNNYTKYNDNYAALINELNENLAEFLNIDSDRKQVSDMNFRILHGLLGIITESAEIAQILLKYLESGTVDIVNCVEEGGVGGGDIGWYQAILSDEFNVTAHTGMHNVIEKLKVRYPEKYTDDNASSRNLVEERIILEKL